MNYAWMCPIPLEAAVAQRPDLIGMFSVAGDSMIFVDKHGRRVVNEKLPYNELAQAFFAWDAGRRPSTRTWSWSRSGTSAARTTRRATSTAG